MEKKGAEDREKIQADALHPRPLPWKIPSEAALPLPIPTAARQREVLGPVMSRVCSVGASWQAAEPPTPGSSEAACHGSAKAMAHANAHSQQLNLSGSCRRKLQTL